MNNLINKLHSLNLFLVEKDGDLILKGRKGKLTPEEIGLIKKDRSIIEFIKKNKQSLVEYLIKEKKNKPAIYKLSPLQESLLFHGLYNKDSNAYTEQMIVDFPNGLDVKAFKESWEYVIRHHSILRTSILHDKLKVPVQCVHPFIELPFEEVDFTAFPEAVQQQKIKAFIAADQAKGFDFSEAPLMRIHIFNLGKNQYKMVWTYHHILLDGWSMPIVTRELLIAYESYARGLQPEEKEEDRYEDYIKYIQSKDEFELEGFWTDYMSGLDQPSLLPFVNTDAERNKTAGTIKKSDLVFTLEETEKIKAYAQSLNITVNTLLQGVWSFLLSIYTGQKETVFGVTVSGRPSDMKNIESKVGLYLNTLPLRSKITDDQSIAEWLTNIQKEHVNGREYQYATLSTIQQWSKLEGELFDSLLIFENFPIGEVAAQKKWLLETKNMEVREQTNFLLTIIAGLTDKLEIYFNYKADHLDPYYMERINGHVKTLLLQIAGGEKELLSDLTILSPAEKMQVLEQFNKTNVAYELTETIIDLFEKQVENTPKKTALTFGDQSYTFEAINASANQLARHLQAEYNVAENDLVAIHLDQSEQLLISILAVLKCGAAYVPIDTSNPMERVQFVASNSGSQMTLDQEKINAFKTLDKTYNSDNILRNTKLEDTFAVIYTSGSSSTPKGVSLSHSNVLNRLNWMWERYPYAAAEVGAMKTSISFVDHICEIFNPLLAGVGLVLFPKSTLLEVDSFIEQMAQNKISRIVLVPSLLKEILAQKESCQKNLQALKYWTSSGETLNKQLVKDFYDIFPQHTLLNIYGSTEVSADACFYDTSVHQNQIEKLNSIPIGQALDNVKCYILDAQLQALPVGVSGEICIGGQGVAKGYINDATLMAEKFVANPFIANERLYRTGDIGRWLPDGNIEFLGRKDDQIKIRGYRINLSEIESVLLQMEGVQQGVLTTQEGPDGQKRLIAYFVAEGNIEKREVHQHLKTFLPDYMVPSILVALKELPLNTSGKVDKKRLPAPDASAILNKAYVAPRNETEMILAEVWKGLLKIDRVGVQDNFFEIGGHSLLAMRFVSALRSKMAATISIKDVFDQPTIEELAELIIGQESGTMTANTFETGPRPDKIPLSFSQEGLWFIDQLTGTVQYHMPTVLRIDNRLDRQALAQALKDLVNKHEILRTVILSEDGQPYQEVRTAENWQMTYSEGAQFDDPDFLKDFMEQEVNQTFDLAQDYMLRAHLVKCNAEEHVLILVVHHIAADGWSVAILKKDLMSFYATRKANQTPQNKEATFQYPDFANWQRQNISPEKLAEQLDWWDQQLNGIEYLELPTDFPYPAIKSSNGDSIDFAIEKELADQLRKLSQEQGSTLFMTLLAAYKVLLYRYSGQEDICVGTSIANRDQEELEQAIGFFVNTLALRSDLSGNPDFADFLQSTKTNTLTALDYQNLPFKEVVNKVVKNRSLSRSPLFQVMFVMLNLPGTSEENTDDLGLSFETAQQTTAQFDITLSVAETPEGIAMKAEYCTDLFRKATVEKMLQNYVEILEAVCENPTQKIADFSLLDETETIKILNDFNQTKTNFPNYNSVLDLFNLQVFKQPEQKAISFENRSLSYQELDEQANQLAHYLKNNSVGAEDIIGLCLDFSLEMIVGLLGILKAGAAYLPIDPSYPKERVKYLIEDSGTPLLLCSQATEHLVHDLDNLKTIQLDQQWKEISKASKEKLPLEINASNLAYLIYTSGSTGQPKGVMIEQSSLLNYLNASTEHFGPELEYFSFPLFTSLSFDLTQTSIFLSLTTGGTLFIEDPEDIDVALQNICDNELINAIKLTPSHINLLEDKKAHFSVAIVGGEELKENHVSRLRSVNENIFIYNEYGPTEATIGCTVELIKENQKITIGTPIANTKIYILDAYGSLVPTGVNGELCIGGSGLARGYLNRPELTQEKFILDPFDTSKNAKIYKTGDRARWLPDGRIEYLGRVDDQIKIRGHRIEPGEVEKIILQSGLVKECVVLPYEKEDGRKYLLTYFVAEEKNIEQEIRAYLIDTVPEYMVPAAILDVVEIPLTVNGKVDKRALPLPDFLTGHISDFTAPRNELESQLANIWRELLKIDTIDVFTNFFELGGDSIISIQAVSRAKKQGIPLKPRDLFLYPSIATLATYVETHTQNEVDTEQGELSGPAILLPVQEWFFDNEQNSMGHFNQAILLQLEKGIEPETLKEVGSALIARHDAFRFTYTKEEDQWQQSYGQAENFACEEIDLSHYAANQLAEAIESNCQKYQESLDIHKGQVFKMVWIKTPETEKNNRLFLLAHHLVMDGVSWRILLDDLELALKSVLNGQAIDFYDKGSSYRQWGQHLQTHSESLRITAQLPYWQDVVKEYRPLPQDTEATEIFYKDLTGISEKLSIAESDRLLKEAHTPYHTDVQDLLLCALAATINTWSEQEEVLLGLEGHGRENLFPNIDTSNTVGWFTTIYPVKLSIGKDTSTANQIKSLKEQIRQIPDKGIGFGLLRYLHPSEEIRSSLSKGSWDILFNYLGQLDGIAKEDGLFQVAQEASGRSIADDYQLRSKLQIIASVIEGQLTVKWVYSSAQYAEATIQQLAQKYMANLKQLIDHCVAMDKVVYTPHDLALSPEVDYQELDLFFEKHQEEIQIDSVYRLSPMQKNLLFYGLYDNHSKAYNEQVIINLSADLNVDALQNAFGLLLKNHSILSSSFYHDELSIPVQAVGAKVSIPFEEIDLSAWIEEDREAKIQEILAQVFKNKTAFDKAPLLKVTLVRTGPMTHRLILNYHHILMDGWSFSLFMGELLKTYEDLVLGKEIRAQKEDQYEDFIKYIYSKDPHEEETFWKSYLQGFEKPSLLPFVQQAISREKGTALIEKSLLVFEEDFSQKIVRYAQQSHVTVNTLVQGVWAYLLSVYAGNKDVVFGVTVSGRPPDLENAEQKIGLFMNTIPVRVKMDADQKIESWLAQLQKEHTNARTYQHSELSEIQQWQNIQGELFDHVLVFENFPVGELLTKKWALHIDSFEVRTQNNLVFSIIAGLGKTLNIQFEYNQNLLEVERIDRIRDHFKWVMEQIVEQKATSVADLSLLNEKEKQELIVDFNQTQANYPETQTPIALFEQQVAQTPDAPALVFEGKTLSYAELNAQAEKLAYHLKQEVQVQAGDLVALMLEQSDWAIIAILGILKSGAAYLPIDLEYPADRKAFMLKDAEAKALIIHSNHLFDVVDFDSAIFAIDIQLEAIEVAEYEREPAVLSDLVYSIYTSGSTGLPKGVLLENRNLLNYIHYGLEEYGKGMDRLNFPLFTSLAFDLTQTSIFLSLLSGGTLFIENGNSIDEILKKVVDRVEINAIKMTPAHAHFLEGLQSNHLKVAIVGGEQLEKYHLEKLFQVNPKLRVINEYGPTETTIGCTIYEINHPDTPVLIGKPIANTQLYLLDESGQLVPKDTPGEIYIAGKGVARGYQNRPALNEERFVDNPFDKNGSKLYKTGDLARWTLEGQLEFIGRKDDQVKINGYRIELGEIENVLQSAESIQACTVLTRGKTAGAELIAFIVADETWTPSALKAHLSEKLPPYFIPAQFIALERIPLTTNGKVDKKALLQMDIGQDSEETYRAPENKMEEQLVVIWEKVLERENIGTQDDFFDLGGNSILAMRAVLALQKAFQQDFNVGDVFNHPTIKGLAELLRNKKGRAVHSAIIPSERPANVPLSYTQEGVWFVDQIEGSTAYHIPIVLKLKGELNADYFEAAIRDIIERHEVLRTVFKTKDGIAYQKVMQADLWKLKRVETADNALIKQMIHDEISQPFSLDSSYLIRATLVKRSEQEFNLILVMHHIASDGWSFGIFINELMEGYRSRMENREALLQELPIQYADYAIWQRKIFDAEVPGEKLLYWRNQLKGLVPTTIPGDLVLSENTTNREVSCLFSIDEKTTDQLKALVKEESVTLFIVLVTVFKVLLLKTSRQEDICIGIPVANRTIPGTENLIGYFLNTLPLRNNLGDNPTFLELLQSVKDNTVNAFANQSVPFQKMVEQLKSEKLIGDHPLFEIVFDFHNEEVNDLVLPDLEIALESFERETPAKFDLALDLVESAGKIVGNFRYDPQRFHPQKIEGLADQYNELIKNILNQPSTEINAINHLSEDLQQEQRDELIDFFNT